MKNQITTTISNDLEGEEWSTSFGGYDRLTEKNTVKEINDQEGVSCDILADLIVQFQDQYMVLSKRKKIMHSIPLYRNHSHFITRKKRTMRGDSQSSIHRTTFDSLEISYVKAMRIIRTLPALITYRIERSKRMVNTLATSLGMNRSEVTHLVEIYPR